MSVSVREFQRWVDQWFPGVSTRELARLSGLKSTTLHQQIVRNKVAESTVISAARAKNLDPLEALSSFEGYADLLTGTSVPTEAELLSQVHYLDVLREVLGRAGDLSTMEPSMLRPIPQQDSVRSWVDAIDPGDLRAVMAARLGITASTLSTRLKTKFAVPLAVDIARQAGVSLASGLVVGGLLTESEGGWPTNGRFEVLRALGESDLFSLAIRKLTVVNRGYWQKQHNKQQAEEFWGNLG